MLKLNKETNPLDQISDLIEVLDQCLGQDYLIAGGFVRDWYQDKPFNDVDIYLFRDLEAKEKLLNTGRFHFIKISDMFIDTVFHEKGPFLTRGRPRYNVQFISWYKDPQTALESFDFEHCKFFIPMNYLKAQNTTSNHFKGFIPRIPYAYDKAVEMLNKKELCLSKESRKKLEEITSHSHGLSILERHIKRTKKFVERGFFIPEELKSTLFSSTENFLKNKDLDKKYSGSKSILMEDIDYEVALEGESRFSEVKIAENLIKELISIYDEAERAVFLLSPIPLIREAAKQALEKALIVKVLPSIANY